MHNITYKQIDKAVEAAIISEFGQWIRDYGCIHHGEGCYSFAAFCADEPVGFISTFPLQYPAPLQECRDAYIDVIEVREAYRRQSIASKLIEMTEAWAKAYGYRQIRSWSADDKTEAIPMWYKLAYAVCPAVMRGESVIKEFAGKPIYGFYVAKVLNDNLVTSIK